jgi:hypothetical protein
MVGIAWQIGQVSSSTLELEDLNKQDSIGQIKGHFHEEVLVQIFMLDDM